MVTLSTEVLVIGGGGTGAGVAWDAALRGLDVVLVDRADLAEGTSGRFHGLLHSGGRYAVKDPRAAEECIGENRILRRVAADCIEDTGGLFVTTPFDDPDHADKFAQPPGNRGECEEVSASQALRDEPLLNPGHPAPFSGPGREHRRLEDRLGDRERWCAGMSRGCSRRGAGRARSGNASRRWRWRTAGTCPGALSALSGGAARAGSSGWRRS